MATYATLSDLRALQRDQSLNEQASVIRKAEQRSPAGATFLSHSSADRELLSGAITLLENHGATVYIDKKDPTLPPYTNRTTAKTLRNRISQSRKFVLFATKASSSSKWMPWELGLSDGIKTQNNIAILPGVDSASDYLWAEREYLAIYDRIVHGRLVGWERPVWMVWDQENDTGTELRQWLAS